MWKGGGGSEQVLSRPRAWKCVTSQCLGLDGYSTTFFHVDAMELEMSKKGDGHNSWSNVGIAPARLCLFGQSGGSLCSWSS